MLQDLGSRDPTIFYVWHQSIPCGGNHAVRTKKRVYVQIRKLSSGSNYICKLNSCIGPPEFKSCSIFDRMCVEESFNSAQSREFPFTGKVVDEWGGLLGPYC